MAPDRKLEVVPRDKWGALPPKSPGTELDHPIEYIWLRSEPEMRPCLTQEKCIKACQTLQKRDMEAPKSIDINANFIIGDDGRIYEGRGLFVKPRKSKEFPKYDGEYIEIVYIGPLDDMYELQIDKMLKTFDNFVYKYHKNGYLNKCPEFLGFFKDHIHTPEQYKWPEPSDVIASEAKDRSGFRARE